MQISLHQTIICRIGERARHKGTRGDGKMYYTTIRHTHNIAGQIQHDAQRLIDHMQALNADKPTKASVSFVLDPSHSHSVPWDEIDQLIHNPFAGMTQDAGMAQTQDEERFLWFLNFELHGEKRIWWTYFHDFFEIHACLTQISQAFPCFKLLGLEICRHGLRVCSAPYASTSSRQQRLDAKQPEVASLRDKQFFPLAPFASDYLTSFLKGLGDAGPCAQCQAPHLPAGTPPASQA